MVKSNMKNNENKRASRGFTLAESLITIMIIGVVMALMLRAINRVNPDKDKLMYIKAYHTIEAVIGEAISNPRNYDQTYLDDDSGATAEHSDFSTAPLDTAQVNINGATVKNLTRGNAICYFLADQINTIGDVNCAGGVLDFRSSGNVCFRKWTTVNASGTVDGVIDPSCDNKPEKSYVVRVSRDGKISVPQSAAGYTNQKKAYDWMTTQTELKEKTIR